MVRVSIDVDAARGVSSSLRSTFDKAMDEWTAVANAAAAALVSTASLKALQDPLVLIAHSADDLDARVKLALLYNTGDHGQVPAGGVLAYEVPGNDDSIQAVKQQLGKELAQNLSSIKPGNRFLDRDDVEQYDFYADLLDQYKDDPDVMKGMFDEMGPQGVVDFPIQLKNFLDAYQRTGAPNEEDRFWSDGKPMALHIAEMQQRFMESFGTGFGNYTRTPGFDEKNYSKGIVDAAKQRTGQGWGLSQVLRYGDYDSAFLVDVGAGLYDIEKGAVGPVWGNQLDGQVQNWSLGNEGKNPYYDPFVGLFEAMGRNPEASLDFFNPENDSKTALDRSKYFIQDRVWRDGFNALGEALDGASTAFHKAGDPDAERAAWVAAATVHFLGDREGDPAIGDEGKDSFAHLLSSYIADVDRVANGTTGSFGVFHGDVNSPWEAGRPPGADFELDKLKDVLAEVLTDKGAAAQLGNATAALNGDRINWAAAHWDAPDGDRKWLQASVNQSATLQGFILATMGAGLTTEAKQADENAKTFIDLASNVVGLVPTGGTLTSFLADQALSAGTDAASSKWTGNESRVDGEQHTVRELAYGDLQIALAIAMAEHDKLPAGAITDETGRTYPWFAGGSFDADALADPGVRDRFGTWLRSGDGGQTLTALLPDLAALFDRGVEHAK